MSETKTDFELRVEDVLDEELSRVWEVLSRIGQGLVLEGYRVELSTWKDSDGDESEAELVTLGPPEQQGT